MPESERGPCGKHQGLTMNGRVNPVTRLDLQLPSSQCVIDLISRDEPTLPASSSSLCGFLGDSCSMQVSIRHRRLLLGEGQGIPSSYRYSIPLLPNSFSLRFSYA